MIKPTTALKKICALTKKIWGIQGGQGAGKTFSILIVLINYAAGNRGKHIFIASDELSKMRITVIKDFIEILALLGLSSKVRLVGGVHATFPNGSFIRFIGLDKTDVGKGLRSDVIFVNEANKVDFETFRELTSRAKRVIIDFNPNFEFWFHTEVQHQKNCEFLKLTYLDNQQLSAEEKTEILSYYEKGYDADGNVKNEYWANKWRIYGLGEIGGVEGVIFSNYRIIDELPKIAKYTGTGLDFGYSNDPTSAIDRYLLDGVPIYDEVCYQTEMSNSDIARILKDSDFKRTIYADSAEPKSIADIKGRGVRILSTVKGRDSINYGINIMQEQEFWVTRRSVNLIRELTMYSWKKDRSGMSSDVPIDNHNHAIDSCRYVEMSLKRAPRSKVLTSRVY